MTVSIGLAANRLMAKIAAGRDKPRGFAVIGAEEAAACWRTNRCDCCPASVRRWPAELAALGITRLGQLQALNDRDARAPPGRGRAGAGARGRGARMRARFDPARETKSISAETTFVRDLTSRAIWNGIYGGWRRNWRGG